MRSDVRSLHGLDREDFAGIWGDSSVAPAFRCSLPTHLPKIETLNAKRPDGGRKRPDGGRKRPDGARKCPDGARKSPGWVRKRPGGVRKRPDGARKRPDGARKRLDGAKVPVRTADERFWGRRGLRGDFTRVFPRRRRRGRWR